MSKTVFPGSVNTDALQESVDFSELLQSRGIELRPVGLNLVGLCPFHDEKTGSLTLYPADGHAHCFGCGWSGRPIKFVMDFDGVDFHEACRRLADGKLDQFLDNGAAIEWEDHSKAEQPKARNPGRKNRTLSRNDQLYCQRCRRELIENTRLREDIANANDWPEKTLGDLAVDGSLGADRSEKKLIFIYHRLWNNGHAVGFKHRICDSRWRRERKVWWTGSPFLWRTSYFCRSAVRNVIVAEGESDAITLIFNGFEQPFSGEDSTAVIAIPSATTFKAEWSPLFGGKNVALLFDNDAAGELASERVGKLISPHARKVQSLDWKEVTV